MHLCGKYEATARSQLASSEKSTFLHISVCIKQTGNEIPKSGTLKGFHAYKL